MLTYADVCRYTTFDLADVYGEAEEYVGAFHERYGQAEGVLFNSKWSPRGSSPKVQFSMFS